MWRVGLVLLVMGLVGTARKDGVNGAKAVLAYLETTVISDEGALPALQQRLNQLPKQVVSKTEIDKLQAVESARAEQDGLEEFKFASNEEMLTAINR